MTTRFRQDYGPLYFLASLGMGGLAVSFFMYVMFLTKHPETPIATFDSVAETYRTGSTGIIVMTTVALVAILWFSIRHFQLLFANLLAFGRYRTTPAYASLRSSNAEVQVMAIPLTLAMSVNVLFVLGALAIPGLWGAIEVLLPIALALFGAIGVLGTWLFGRYLVRAVVHREFDPEDTNHFSQVLPAFAFVMVAVGFASPAAMSHHRATAVIGMLGTFVFLTAAAAWILVKLPVSFGAMLRHGIAPQAGSTLWLGIPIFTLVGISAIRVLSGVAHSFSNTELSPAVAFVLLGLLLAAQLVMGVAGYLVMRAQGYFATYVRGNGASVPAYGLVCPGVAVAVLGMFFIHWGLVRTETIALFSWPHLALLGIVLAVQVRTIETAVRLNRKLLGSSDPADPSHPRAEELEVTHV
ncbi:hypothetical protein [Nocardioides sp.]|uniref:TsoY family (seleno)protein n=1 Tax=Nocardioides sp. TaxID=35761 RepID=UPI0027359169|nr:hypothetical protein [Nocardioides sp.]MDP3893808.1 hypothetical protein [Nocardioides sp.]